MTSAATSIMTTSLSSPTARKLLEDLDEELMALYPDHPYPPPFGDDEATGVGTVLIAYRNRRAVGCGAVRQLDDDTAELMRMYVLPTSRGKGVGKTILTALEHEATDMGAGRVVLEAGDRQPDALGLYQNSGYTRIESWIAEPNPHSVFMAKSI